MSPAISTSRIHDGPLPAALLVPRAVAPCHGAVASFLGVVRNHAGGRGVIALDYTCHREMAERLLNAMCDEAARRFDPALSIDCLHGIGAMRPGDVALVIHAASAHRAAAFDAVRFLIESIKHDLPVWKHQHYDNGTSAWLHGS